MTTTLSPTETRLLDALDERALIDDLVRLVQVPSVTGTDAESELMGSAAGEVSGAELEVDHWRIDLDEVAARLNGRPRQTLGFMTPSQVLERALR